MPMVLTEGWGDITVGWGFSGEGFEGGNSIVEVVRGICGEGGLLGGHFWGYWGSLSTLEVVPVHFLMDVW